MYMYILRVISYRLLVFTLGSLSIVNPRDKSAQIVEVRRLNVFISFADAVESLMESLKYMRYVMI